MRFLLKTIEGRMQTPRVKVRRLNKLLGLFGWQFVILYDISGRKDTKIYLEFIGW